MAKECSIFALRWRFSDISPFISPPYIVSCRRSSFIFSSSLEQRPTNLADGGGGSLELTTREKRQVRNLRRESKAGTNNWREEVEERLMKKPKKKMVSWMEELNLDNLALAGAQWWVIRVARVRGTEIAERIARSLVKNYPGLEFKVYYPTVREKRRLKNGSITTKAKPILPGCIFVHCVLNKEIHDFIREFDGVGGFFGSKVGNSKRMINKPKPVSVEEMEAVFQQVKEEQEAADQAYDDENSTENPNLTPNVNAARMSKKARGGSSNDSGESLLPGISVRVLSGPFMQFTGYLKKFDRKSGKATIGFRLFGKESLAEVEVNQIVPVTN